MISDDQVVVIFLFFTKAFVVSSCPLWLRFVQQLTNLSLKEPKFNDLRRGRTVR